MSKTLPPAVPPATPPAGSTLDPLPAPAATPDPFAHVGDPSWGRGGSYVIDPNTGARVPAPNPA